VVADAKSEIKWLEAAVLGIPSVVSDTHRYREVLEDGVDALIARDAPSWRAALTRLIDNPSLRAEIGSRARAKALKLYAPEPNAARLQAALAPADRRAEHTRAARDAAERRPRVLLVNAFFPPQTIGGATRVVRDNLDAFLAADAGLDFAVACTDHGSEHWYHKRVESYAGCPVFRLSTPQAVNMDWNPLDRIAGDLFAEVLDSWKPDLVHFHATQRLTGAAVQACAEAQIPYLVTAHDAWWVSDWQFLVDDDDRLRQPCEPIPYDPPAPATVGDAMARRRYLAALLGGAERVLGVSRTFATCTAPAASSSRSRFPTAFRRCVWSRADPRRPVASACCTAAAEARTRGMICFRRPCAPPTYPGSS
jgi:hypothetical protein